MKSLISKLVLCVLPLLCINLSLSAQLCTEGGLKPDGTPCVNTIITAVPFLRIIPDARSGAMGDVGISISPDANAMHFNASKLAFAEQDFSLSATYTPWLQALGLKDVYLAYLSMYKRIDKLQTAGMSIRYFSLGSIEFTDENGGALGSDRPNEFEIAGAYSRKLSDRLSTGLTLKYIYSKLANGQTTNGNTISPGNAMGADFSLYYNKPLTIADRKAVYNFGLAISNIGTKISYTKSVNKDFIPTNLGIGNSLELYLDDYNSVTLAVDINKLLVPTPDPDLIDEANGGNGIPDYKEVSGVVGMINSFGDAPTAGEEFNELMYSVGLEYWYDKQFAVRVGHYNEHRNKGNRKFFTVGLGLKYSIFGLNFSYLVPTSNQRNPLDNTLRFSLLFDFGSQSGKDTTPSDL